MPLGALVAGKKLMNAFTEHPELGHITTFGGHPVSCAAGMAAMKVLLKENIIQDVADKSKLFAELLQHKKIKAVRCSGLLIAIEFDSFETNKKIIDRCIDKGVLTDWFLFAPHCLRIVPPLNISEEEILQACNIINAVRLN